MAMAMAVAVAVAVAQQHVVLQLDFTNYPDNILENSFLLLQLIIFRIGVCVSVPEAGDCWLG